MGKVIKIRDAQIRTVSMEIKSMTIDDRQVTLALFRQLIEEDLISRAGTLNGLPWGFVNYHPGKCADSKLEHWHIVWQKGDELRRATELQEPRFGPLCSDLIDQWANVSVCVAFEAAPGVRFNEHVEADGPTVCAH